MARESRVGVHIGPDVTLSTHRSLDVILADILKHLLGREGGLVLHRQSMGTP